MKNSFINTVSSKIGIKKGDIYAQSLADQSYIYRLMYVWIGFLMIQDKRNTPINPLKWSVIDVFWVLYFSACSAILFVVMVIYSPFEALRLGEVKPVNFFGDKESTDYTFVGRWYFDNGKIRTK